MKQMSIAQKLGIGFGIFVALLCLAVYVGVARLDALNETVERIAQKDWQKSVLANDILDETNAIARNTLLLFLPGDRDAAVQRIAANRQAINGRMQTLEGLVYHPEGKALLAEIGERRKVFIPAYGATLDLLKAGRDAEAARTLVGEVMPALEAQLGTVNKLVQLQGRILEDSARLSAETYASSRTLLLAGLAVAVVLGILLAVWIIRSVVRPLGGEPDDARRVVDAIASGDLTVSIPVRAGDEQSLIAAMARMQSSLQRMVSELKANADSVAAAAAQLASSSSQVATATAVQSEAAAAMAAAVQEMTVSVNHVAERAHDANGVTAKTGAMASDGDGVIQRTVGEMQEIARIVGSAAETIRAMGEHSREISSIVQVIKEVAEQTNLLALNAAIEAARAGEQGRGFAVVADEVRKLAERTAKATTEIGSMIAAVQSSALSAVDTMRDAVTRVEEGVGLARQAGTSMTGISNGAQDVVSSVTEISNALREQSTASNEIAVNVERIAQMSEENNAATREAAATAVQLEALAAETRSAMARFRLCPAT